MSEEELELCDCGETADNTTRAGAPICDDCAWYCEHCEDVLFEADTDWYQVDGERWCQSCVYDDAQWCDRCEEYTSDGTNYIQDIGVYWCNDCASYRANWCDNCEHWTADTCDSCDQSDTNYEGERVIHDYSYRPDIVLHSTDSNERLYFGFELEMELEDNRRDAAIYAHAQLEPEDYGYLKNDGSLDQGFELVTHPMSFDFLMDEDDSGKLWSTIRNLQKVYDARSFNTRTCGFHIHISRTGFNSGAHMHRFLNLVYSNENFYSKLAGRKSDQWAKFTDVLQREYDSQGNSFKIIKSFKAKLNDDDWRHESDRYSAVNTRPRETLEMRIFKGTMSIPALKAHIQLAHASVEYTRNLSVKDVRDGALNTENFLEYIKQNNHLYPELLTRIESKGIWETLERRANPTAPLWQSNPVNIAV